MKDVENRRLAVDLQCVIVSVDYRLAPESPYPAALHDVYSVLVWMHTNPADLRLDVSCIGIKGEVVAEVLLPVSHSLHVTKGAHRLRFNILHFQ